MRLHPNEYKFIPKTYFMQYDWKDFKAIKRAATKRKLWIIKPSRGAQGKGIQVINKLTKIKKRSGYIISEYLSKPHLLEGFKYDLRLYVAVLGLDPIRIYLHDEGLVRICTHKYSTK